MLRLRSFVDRARFKAHLHRRAALDIGMAVAGLALIFFDGRSTVDILGASLALAGAVRLARELAQRSRQRLNVRAVDNEDYAGLVKDVKPPAGYEKAGFGDKAYVTSLEINLLLDEADNPIHLGSDKFEVPVQIRAHLEPSVDERNPDSNQDKAGLRTDLTPALLKENLPVKVQPSDYFRATATNDIADQKFERCDDSKRHRKWTLDYAVSALVFDRDELFALSDSELANNIGVTSLLIAADHHIVLQNQGAQTVDPGRVNLGSSGSLDLADLHDLSRPGAARLRTLQEALRYGMEREANEEVGAAVGAGLSSTILTGYARYLHRGGKPEFFGITRTASLLDDLKPKASELKFVHRIFGERFDPTPAGFLEAVEMLLGRCEEAPGRYSPSMAVGLRLARSYVERFGLDLVSAAGSLKRPTKALPERRRRL